jgi:hypothetical protein
MPVTAKDAIKRWGDRTDALLEVISNQLELAYIENLSRHEPNNSDLRRQVEELRLKVVEERAQLSV